MSPKSKVPPLVYWLLYKPALCATLPKKSEDSASIYDLPKLKKLPFKISPLGHLDFQTEGLLLLTNDVALLRAVQRHKDGIPRQYVVLANGKLEPSAITSLKSGKARLNDGPVQPLQIRRIEQKKLGATVGHWYELELKEERFKLVRRLFAAHKLKVLRMIAVGFGSLRLHEEQKPGTYRQLTSTEIKTLRRYFMEDLS